jgi:hypothetical protein
LLETTKKQAASGPLLSGARKAARKLEGQYSMPIIALSTAAASRGAMPD